MKKIKYLSLALATIVGMASCEKKFDDNFNTNYDGKTVMINYAVEPTPALIVVEPPASGDLVLDLGNVSISTPGENNQEITVKLRLNPTLIADYNSQHGTAFEAFNSSSINLPLTFKIPAGSKQAPIIARVNPALIDLSKKYAIGLSIESLTGADGYSINPLYKDCLYSVLVKNKYDGKFKLNGVHNRPPAGTYGFPYLDVDMEMHTTGASSVRFYFSDAGDYGHPIGIGPGTLSWYGPGIGPNLTVSPSTNAIIGANNLGGATVIDLDPSVTTHRYTFNSSTNKPDKIYVSFRYNLNQDRRFFDTLTYVGPR